MNPLPQRIETEWHTPEVGDRYDNRWGDCFTVERVEPLPAEQGYAVCRWDNGDREEFRFSTLNGGMFIRLAR